MINRKIHILTLKMILVYEFQMKTMTLKPHLKNQNPKPTAK